MNRNLKLIAFVAAAALAGCNSEDHTLVQDDPHDPMANELANAAPVELPPSIQSSKTYRCKDNSLVYVDWMSDGSANLRAEKNGPATRVVSAEPGKPMTAEGGYSVAGDAAVGSITIGRPGKGSQSCKA